MKRILILLCCACAALAKKPRAPELTPLEAYIQAASEPNQLDDRRASGSLWSEGARLGDLASDLRARRVDDVLTIVVEERASALSRGSVSSSRKANATARVDAAAGPRTSGWMPNLASLSSNRTLDGQGETVRETVLSTVLTARVTHVMPNGNLIVEAVKNVTVNSETQKVIVRGLVRPIDLSTGNAVRSNQIGMLEVSVAGKGVVGDAVKQPNVLYRILLGLLPF